MILSFAQTVTTRDLMSTCYNHVVKSQQPPEKTHVLPLVQIAFTHTLIGIRSVEDINDDRVVNEQIILLYLK